jgi:hypothetical protein
MSRTVHGPVARSLFLLAWLVLGAGAHRGAAQSETPSSTGEVQVGEELVYNVSYGFFDLGQIRITTVERLEVDGRPCYFSRAYIDSYSNIPFVDLHAVFESVIDMESYSRRFMGKVKQDGAWDFNRYRFDYPANRVFIESGNRDTVVAKRDTTEVRAPYQDGLSLYFYARHHLFDGQTRSVPTLVQEKKVATVINFGPVRTSVEIDAVDYPVDVAEFDGTMEFTGIFGLTGDFEGWFSNDAARVPITAKMKVIIGSVTVELMEWKRPGWTPPRAQE